MSIQKRGGGFELNASFSLGVFPLEDKKKKSGRCNDFQRNKYKFWGKNVNNYEMCLGKKVINLTQLVIGGIIGNRIYRNLLAQRYALMLNYRQENQSF
jgi:hypothetical protein